MGECEGGVRVVCEGEWGGRDTPPSLLEIKGAQAQALTEMWVLLSKRGLCWRRSNPLR